MKRLTIEIISIKKSLFKGEVDALVVPGTKGPFEVLSLHAPIISTLAKGDICYTIDGKEHCLAIEYGFIELFGNNIIICVGEVYDSSKKEKIETDEVKDGEDGGDKEE